MNDTIVLNDDDSVFLKKIAATNSATITKKNKIVKLLNKEKNKQEYNNSSIWSSFLFIFLLFIVIYILTKFFEVAKLIFSDFFSRFNNEEDANNELKEYYKNYFVYNGNNLQVNNNEVVAILEKYFIYYRNLEPYLKNKFYKRLMLFMNDKQFIIHSNEPFKEMPILISAAAIQISFGLTDFELPHYKYIRIHKEEYFAADSLRILAGNVQGNCITLAWNQLLKGYGNYEDGNNVGLHEMAHALYFQEIVIDQSNAENFAQYFNELMNKGETILQNKVCPHQLYTEYAFSNLQEFWAASVELFFEKTNQLSTCYPPVFEALQKTLNQNPYNTKEPV